MSIRCHLYCSPIFGILLEDLQLFRRSFFADVSLFKRKNSKFLLLIRLGALSFRSGKGASSNLIGKEGPSLEVVIRFRGSCFAAQARWVRPRQAQKFRFLIIAFSFYVLSAREIFWFRYWKGVVLSKVLSQPSDAVVPAPAPSRAAHSAFIRSTIAIKT